MDKLVNPSLVHPTTKEEKDSQVEIAPFAPNHVYSNLFSSNYDVFYQTRSAQAHMQVGVNLAHTNPRMDCF